MDVREGAAHLVALLCLAALIKKRRTLSLSSPLRIYALTVLLGGLLLHLAGVQIYTHYLIVFSPLLHVAAAWVLVHAQRRLLWVALGLQLFISACFLGFIHAHGGAPRGDYGVSYSAQDPAERVPGVP